MKRILLSLLFLPATVLAAEQHFSNFAGVNTYLDPILISDNEAVSAVNVLTDEGDLRTIYGNTLYATVATSSITFLKEWINSAGQRVAFVKSGLSLYATDPTSGTITSIATFAGETNLDMVAAFNRAYFTDGTAYPFYSTGTSTTAASGMEDCELVESYQTRLACINMSTESSKIYLSWYNEPSSWTVTASADSAAIKYFHKDDGEEINCAYSTTEGLFVGKDSSVGMLKGDDNENFYWYYISDDVGCVDDRTVQLVDGELVWLARDGYYAYNFSGVPRNISLKIKPYTDIIRRSNSFNSNWTMNTQAEWESGEGWDAWSTATGKLIAPAYWGNIGTLMGFQGEGCEGLYLGNQCLGWTSSGGFPFDNMVTGHSKWGLRSVTADQGIAGWAHIPITGLAMHNATSDILIASTTMAGFESAPDVWEYYTIDYSSDTSVKLLLCVDYPSNCIKSSAFNGLHGAYIAKSYYGDGYGWVHIWDHPEATALGTDSTVIDSGILTPTCTGFDYITAGSTVTLYTSADNSSWSGPYFSSDTFTTNVCKRYYKFTTNYTATSDTLTYMKPLIASATEYLSPVKYTANDIAAWKLFNLSYTDQAATPTFYVRSATYTFVSTDTTLGWEPQTNNTQVSTTVAQYVQYRILTGIDSSTQSMTVTSSNLEYTVGSVSPRCASTVDDNRYIASVSSNSATTNDRTDIWQKNKEWVFSDQAYGALGTFNNKPIAGSATSVSKLWYIMDEGAKSFDGVAIESEWISKDFTWGVPNHKRMDRFWIMAENGGVDNFGIAWQKDRNGIWTSTSTALNSSAFVVREVEHMYDSPAVGRLFRFKFSAGELEKYFRLKLYSIFYTVNPLIK